MGGPFVRTDEELKPWNKGDQTDDATSELLTKTKFYAVDLFLGAR